MSTGAKDSSIIASVDETLVARPTLEVTKAQDSTSIPTPKAPVVTVEMRHLMAQLASIFLGVSDHLHLPRARLPPSWRHGQQVL